jgi:transcriptional regulator with XRE-family HTH domain
LEQKGEAMPAKEFRAWRERHKLSLSDAASALGLSRRTVAYYDQGQRIIPKVVWLATKGYDAAAGGRTSGRPPLGRSVGRSMSATGLGRDR